MESAIDNDDDIILVDVLPTKTTNRSSNKAQVDDDILIIEVVEAQDIIILDDVRPKLPLKYKNSSNSNKTSISESSFTQQTPNREHCHQRSLNNCVGQLSDRRVSNSSDKNKKKDPSYTSDSSISTEEQNFNYDKNKPKEKTPEKRLYDALESKIVTPTQVDSINFNLTERSESIDSNILNLNINSQNNSPENLLKIPSLILNTAIEASASSLRNLPSNSGNRKNPKKKFSIDSTSFKQSSNDLLSKSNETFSSKTIDSYFPNKSIAECLYHYCCLRIKNTNDNNNLIIDLDYIYDKIEPHYDFGDIFYLNESFELIQIVLYMQENSKLNILDLFDQFEKTYIFYLKLGKKCAEHVADLNNIISKFLSILNHTNMSLKLDLNANNRVYLNNIHEYWNRILELIEKILKQNTKQTNHNVEIYLVNNSLFNVVIKFLEIFSTKIFDAKICKNRLGFADYFNITDDYFFMVLENFSNLVVRGFKEEFNFINVCHGVQHLIYYSIIFNKIYEKSKSKLIQMINSFESIYMDISLTNQDTQNQFYFISHILIHDEIKMKLCEKLLINCRFNHDETNNTYNSTPKTLLKSKNQSDNNQIIYQIASNKLLKSCKETPMTSEYIRLLNCYLNFYINIISSDITKSITLIPSLFDSHENTDQFTKSIKHLTNKLFNLLTENKSPTKNTILLSNNLNELKTIIIHFYYISI